MVYNQRQRMPQQPGWDSPTLNANASGANLRLYYSFEYGERSRHSPQADAGQATASVPGAERQHQYLMVLSSSHEGCRQHPGRVGFSGGHDMSNECVLVQALSTSCSTTASHPSLPEASNMSAPSPPL